VTPATLVDTCVASRVLNSTTLVRATMRSLLRVAVRAKQAKVVRAVISAYSIYVIKHQTNWLVVPDKGRRKELARWHIATHRDRRILLLTPN